MAEIKPCPFCGGKGKVSFKDNAYGGHNGLGDKRMEQKAGESNE